MQIVLRFYNKGWLKNELIGMYEIDCSTVYFKEKHIVEHQWLGLSNSESEDYDEIKAMFKASFSMQSHLDEPYQLKPQVGPDDPKA